MDGDVSRDTSDHDHEQWDDSLDNDAEAIKRRRVSRACDTCRKKKIRCDGCAPCSNCTAYRTTCIFADVKKKRSAPRGAKYVQTLETRIWKLESFLQRVLPDCNIDEEIDRENGISGSAPADTDSLAGRMTKVVPPEDRASFVALGEPDQDADDLAERMGYLWSNTDGESEYLGASNSVTCLISAQKKIREIMGDTTFDEFCLKSRETISMHNLQVEEDFMSIMMRKSAFPPSRMPDLETSALYIESYFENFQCIYPLLDKDWFLAQIPQMYSRDAEPDLSFRAIYLMVLAFGSHHVRGDSPGQQASEGWILYIHAHSLLFRVVQKQTLRVVQAFLLIGLYLEPCGRQQSLWTLIGAVVRLAQSIGIHRKLHQSNSIATEHSSFSNSADARRRAFWILYLMDNNLVATCGKPAALQDFDCDQDYPILTPGEQVRYGNLETSIGQPFSFFAAQIELARLSHQVQKELYSVSAAASLQSAQIDEAVNDFDQRLQSWMNNLPIKVRPDQIPTIFEHDPRIASRDSDANDAVACVLIPVLHLRYYNLMMTIHRKRMVQSNGRQETGQQSRRSTSADVSGRSRDIALHAARASLAVMTNRIPRMRKQFIRYNLSYPASAVLVIFSNIVKNPETANVSDDIAILRHATLFFTESLSGDDSAVEPFLKFFRECVRVVEKTYVKYTSVAPHSMSSYSSPDTTTSSRQFGHPAQEQDGSAVGLWEPFNFNELAGVPGVSGFDDSMYYPSASWPVMSGGAQEFLPINYDSFLNNTMLNMESFT